MKQSSGYQSRRYGPKLSLREEPKPILAKTQQSCLSRAFCSLQGSLKHLLDDVYSSSTQSPQVISQLRVLPVPLAFDYVEYVLIISNLNPTYIDYLVNALTCHYQYRYIRNVTSIFRNQQQRCRTASCVQDPLRISQNC